MFDITEFTTQPADLRLSPAPLQFQYGPVFLDVQLPPEFVEPTPGAASAEPVSMTVFLGEELTLEMKVVQRNQNQQARQLAIPDNPKP